MPSCARARTFMPLQTPALRALPLPATQRVAADQPTQQRVALLASFTTCPSPAARAAFSHFYYHSVVSMEPCFDLDRVAVNITAAVESHASPVTSPASSAPREKLDRKRLWRRHPRPFTGPDPDVLLTHNPPPQQSLASLARMLSGLAAREKPQREKPQREGGASGRPSVP